jgi:hypothetical protein
MLRSGTAAARHRPPPAAAGAIALSPVVDQPRGEPMASKTNPDTDHGSKKTTNHDEIRKWAESRGAKPACVKGTGGGGDTGLLRLDFPGYSGGESLQEISWDEFFEKFDQQKLALLYQDETSGGQKSNFNKLVRRD